MMHTVEWFGTGGAFTPELGTSNFSITGEGRPLFVDLSTVTVLLLKARGLLGTVRDVAISHVHGDHANGLELLAFYNKNVMRRTSRPNIYVPDTQILADIIDGFPSLRYQNDGPKARRVGIEEYFQLNVGTSVREKGLPNVDFHRTQHIPGMSTYGINVPDTGIWVSGDSRAVLPAPQGTSIAFRDAGGKDTPERVHANMSDLDMLPPADKRNTFLYHLNDAWREIGSETFRIVLPGDVFLIEGGRYEQRTGGRFLYATVPFSSSASIATMTPPRR